MFESEVKRPLQDLEPGKAGGPNDILPSELKTVSLLFNESLATYTKRLSGQYKMANLHPLSKPGKMTLPWGRITEAFR